MDDQLPRIKEAILSILNSLNLELFDLEYAGNARKGVLKVTIDKAEGVKLEDCEKASRNISPLLDVYDFIDHQYTLEVSSPGLDRPLRKIEDFKRVIGKLVHVKTKEPIGLQKVFIGRLISVEENGNIHFLVEQKKKSDDLIISFDNILESNLEVEW
ncbi:MAG: ribosome maturation factor RimP [Nitrospirae bacterium]|nr:ribosome maturation factor RimP [Nitrospirota bacterium]MBI3595267.1 ribosome maturation factor RimP [Nitrospirota bacterium]